MNDHLSPKQTHTIASGSCRFKKPLRSVLFFLLASGVAGTDAGAQVPLTPLDPALLNEAEPLLPPGPTRRWSMPKDTATIELCRDETAPANPLLRVIVKDRMPQPWVVQSSQRFTEEIAVGRTGVLTFRARLLETSERSGKGYVVASVQRNVEPYSKVVSEPVAFGREWTTLTLAFTANEAIPEGEGGVVFSYGWQAQSVEIADVQLYRFPENFDAKRLPKPSFTYEGRETNAPWRTAALKEIERLRTGDLVVRVVDAGGKPLADRPVTVRLDRHHFGFGSAVAAVRFQEQSPDGEKYRKVVDENFSRIVLENDLKLPPFREAQSGQSDYYDLGKTDATLNWMRDRGIRVRGHYLSWGNTEDWSEKLFAEGKANEVKAAILDHARRVTTFTGDRIVEWDAINHPVPFSHVLPEYLGEDIYAELMNEFRKLTDLPLWINEDSIDLNRGSAFEKALLDLKARGVRIDGAGNMSHFRDSRIPSVEEVRGQLDRLAAIAGHVQATEYDLETEDDTLHADHLRDMLILHFAHPACTGFVMWGFWENQHWRPTAAMWRKDWTERPAVEIWREWVGRRWHTEIQAKVDAAGKVRGRAFFGRYRVSSGDGPPVFFEFPPGQKEPITVRLLPAGS